MTEAAKYAARLTLCECGHEAIAHYDSWQFCTHTMSDECDCDEFKAEGPEVFVQIGNDE